MGEYSNPAERGTEMDKAEFTEIVRAYQKQLLVIAFHYCGNRDDAEDVVQDVFVRLWAQLCPPKGEHLRSWLIRVTINRCKDHLRSAQLRLRAPIEAADRVLVEPDETARSVFEAVTALPLPYREVVLLHYYAGCTTREIGRLLRRKPSTVQTQLQRARAILKEQLKEVWEE